MYNILFDMEKFSIGQDILVYKNNVQLYYDGLCLLWGNSQGITEKDKHRTTLLGTTFLT